MLSLFYNGIVLIETDDLLYTVWSLGLEDYRLSSNDLTV